MGQDVRQQRVTSVSSSLSQPQLIPLCGSAEWFSPNLLNMSWMNKYVLHELESTGPHNSTCLLLWQVMWVGMDWGGYLHSEGMELKQDRCLFLHGSVQCLQCIGHSFFRSRRRKCSWPKSLHLGTSLSLWSWINLEIPSFLAIRRALSSEYADDVNNDDAWVRF